MLRQRALRFAYIVLLILTGLAAGSAWGWLEQSPQAKEWLAPTKPPKEPKAPIRFKWKAPSYADTIGCDREGKENPYSCWSI